MAIQKETSRIIPKELLPNQWFRAYLTANKQFVLLPPAIDAIVGLAVVGRIARRKASWQMLAGTGFSEAQLHAVERDMTKLHLAHGIPLVGESMANHHHHGTEKARAILERFISHHGRPLRTKDYHGDTHAGHAVVNRDTVSKTWVGIAGETARAAVYFVRATGYSDRTIVNINEHKRTRENYLRLPIVQALDRYFGDEAFSHAVDGLKQLYHAPPITYGRRRQGILQQLTDSNLICITRRERHPFMSRKNFVRLPKEWARLSARAQNA